MNDDVLAHFDADSDVRRADFVSIITQPASPE
jgi:hypothetical protein